MSSREHGISKPGEPKRMPAAGLICGEQAGPADCTNAVSARGLCRHHYRRLATGRPLVDDGPQPGDPSGHGRWGMLDLVDDRLVCHECGHTYIHLGVHVGMVHDITGREYRIRHGLPVTLGLVTPNHRARLVTNSTDLKLGDNLSAFADPENARQHVDPAMLRRAGRVSSKRINRPR